MAQKPVTKAVIAAAGFGTRFLPQTKAMPKEMLPIIDKPIIQYVVEELVDAGIKDIIIVGSSNKRSIEDHFDLPSEDLLSNLRAGGPKKQPFIEEIEAISNLANFVYVRQKGLYGTATSLQCAAHLIGEEESFIYTWADDFFVAPTSAAKQLIAVYEKTNGGSAFACKTAKRDDEFDKYGFVDGSSVDDFTMKMLRIVEKPGKADAPSALASVSSYLLPGAIFPYIENAALTHEEGEFSFQPMVQSMIDDGYEYYAREIEDGVFCDTGDKLEYLKTVFDFALKHEELGEPLRTHLEKRLKQQ